MNIRNAGSGSLLAALILMALLVVGCGGNTEDTGEKPEAAEVVDTQEVETVAALTEAEEAMVQQIATITKAVEQEPATADAILQKFGMTAEEYEAAVYKIAESPSLSAAYEKAVGK